MPRFAANLTMLFGEVPFLDRFAAASRAGFTAVEYLFPYDYDPFELQSRLSACRLTQILHNLPAGNWAAGERGIACLPDRIAEFDAGVERAAAYAAALGCPQLNCLAGIRPATVEPEAARDTFIRNLRVAARRLGDAGIRLLIEPINTRDVPGFFLCGTDQALEIMDAVGSPHLWLQFDMYHMHVMHEDLAATIERHAARIAHMQLADVPGRHEPGTGVIDYPSLFDRIDRAGYPGWIGCEYVPLGTTEAGLSWLPRPASAP
jgi:hydroxypyruvate isomerase